ncbi:NF-kappa-B inhibitor delta [Synchiropus picturatus]
MHFDKSPKEKPCPTLPTVKKLLEQKRLRESPSVSPSCSSTSTTSPVPPNPVTVSSAEGFSCAGPSSLTGASSGYPEMAVGYEQWNPAPETTFNYYPAQPGPSYEADFSTQLALEYNTAQLQQEYGDPVPQTYGSHMPMREQSCVSHWSMLKPCQAPPSIFGSLDPHKLEEARLLVNGMDNSRVTQQDEDGDTILHIYTAKGLRECAFATAERLRALGSLDTREHKGKTALLVAVTANQPEIVHDLLNLGSDINACDVSGQSALHLAAEYGFPQVLQAIVSNRPGIALETRNFEGMTPLHTAVISHSATIKALIGSAVPDVKHQSKAEEKLLCVQLLLSAGASLLSQEIKSNKTALHLAVKEGNMDLLCHLLRVPLPNIREFVNMKAHGHTALHMAAGLHSHPQQREIMRLLLSKGADPSIRNLDNNLPAHLLQSGPQGEQLKVLLKKRSASSRRCFKSSPPEQFYQ